jgi:hypothetical protein
MRQSDTRLKEQFRKRNRIDVNGNLEILLEESEPSAPDNSEDESILESDSYIATVRTKAFRSSFIGGEDDVNQVFVSQDSQGKIKYKDVLE